MNKEFSDQNIEAYRRFQELIECKLDLLPTFSCEIETPFNSGTDTIMTMPNMKECRIIKQR